MIRPPQPNLGLASTEMLFRELIARLVTPTPTLRGVQRALVLAEMLGNLDAQDGEYQTIEAT